MNMTKKCRQILKTGKSAVWFRTTVTTITPSVPSGHHMFVTANSTSIEYKFLYIQNGTFIYIYRV